MAEGWDVIVRRDDLRVAEIVPAPAPAEVDLPEGAALLAVSRFGLTANNVTYAAFGDGIGYWNFFPADEGWGRVPVWGFADVVRSNHAELPVGDRVFGYLPMSTSLVVRPDRVDAGSFVDASEHRAGLPAAYNRYRRCGGDPGYDAAHEDEQALLWPLFMTSFVLDDFLADQDFFGAGTVVLTSASAKTTFGTAHLLATRESRPEVVGLTSAGNVGFVEGLGCYDRVVPYDAALAALDPGTRTVLVDVAGDRALVRSIHEHLGDALAHSAVVGGTHWEAEGDGGGPLPGPEPSFFFAPTQLAKRARDWGPGGLDERFGEAWGGFLAAVGGWLDIVEHEGPESVAATWLEVLEGHAPPNVAHVLVV